MLMLAPVFQVVALAVRMRQQIVVMLLVVIDIYFIIASGQVHYMRRTAASQSPQLRLISLARFVEKRDGLLFAKSFGDTSDIRCMLKLSAMARKQQQNSCGLCIKSHLLTTAVTS